MRITCAKTQFTVMQQKIEPTDGGVLVTRVGGVGSVGVVSSVGFYFNCHSNTKHQPPNTNHQTPTIDHQLATTD